MFDREFLKFWKQPASHAPAMDSTPVEDLDLGAWRSWKTPVFHFSDWSEQILRDEFLPLEKNSALVIPLIWNDLPRDLENLPPLWQELWELAALYQRPLLFALPFGPYPGSPHGGLPAHLAQASGMQKFAHGRHGLFDLPDFDTPQIFKGHHHYTQKYLAPFIKMLIDREGKRLEQGLRPVQMMFAALECFILKSDGAHSLMSFLQHGREGEFAIQELYYRQLKDIVPESFFLGKISGLFIPHNENLEKSFIAEHLKVARMHRQLIFTEGVLPGLLGPALCEMIYLHNDMMGQHYGRLLSNRDSFESEALAEEQFYGPYHLLTPQSFLGASFEEAVDDHHLNESKRQLIVALEDINFDLIPGVEDIDSKMFQKKHVEFWQDESRFQDVFRRKTHHFLFLDEWLIGKHTIDLFKFIHTYLNLGDHVIVLSSRSKLDPATQWFWQKVHRLMAENRLKSRTWETTFETDYIEWGEEQHFIILSNIDDMTLQMPSILEFIRHQRSPLLFKLHGAQTTQLKMIPWWQKRPNGEINLVVSLFNPSSYRQKGQLELLGGLEYLYKRHPQRSELEMLNKRLLGLEFAPQGHVDIILTFGSQE
jgi:hypothetical protein